MNYNPSLYAKAQQKIVDGTSTAEDKFIQLVAISHYYFQECLSDNADEHLDLANNEMIQDHYVKVKNINGILAGVMEATEQKQELYYELIDVKNRLYKIREEARLNDDYHVLAASYSAIFYDDEQEDTNPTSYTAKGMYFCFEDLINSQEDFFELFKATFTDKYRALLVSPYYVRIICLRKMLSQCSQKISSESLWSYTILKNFYDTLNHDECPEELKNIDDVILPANSYYSWCSKKKLLPLKRLKLIEHPKNVPSEVGSFLTSFNANDVIELNDNLNNFIKFEHIELIIFLLSDITWNIFDSDSFLSSTQKDEVSIDINSAIYDILGNFDDVISLGSKFENFIKITPNKLGSISKDNHNFLKNIKSTRTHFQNIGGIKWTQKTSADEIYNYLKNFGDSICNDLLSNFENFDLSRHSGDKFIKNFIAIFLRDKLTYSTHLDYNIIDSVFVTPYISIISEEESRFKKESDYSENESVDIIVELSELEIGHFKSYSPNNSPQKIKFSPITMIFGGNSGGKTTLLKALCYFGYVIEHKKHPHFLKIGEKDNFHEINFGSFEDVCFKKNKDKAIRISCSFKLTPKILTQCSGEEDGSYSTEVKYIDKKISMIENKLVIRTKIKPKNKQEYSYEVGEFISASNKKPRYMFSCSSKKIKYYEKLTGIIKNLEPESFNKNNEEYRDSDLFYMDHVLFDEENNKLLLDTSLTAQFIRLSWSDYIQNEDNSRSVGEIKKILDDFVENTDNELLFPLNEFLNQEKKYTNAIINEVSFSSSLERPKIKNKYLGPWRDKDSNQWDSLKTFLHAYNKIYHAWSNSKFDLDIFEENGGEIESKEYEELVRRNEDLYEIYSDFEFFKEDILENHLPKNMSLELRYIIKLHCDDYQFDFKNIEADSLNEKVILNKIPEKSDRVFLDGAKIIVADGPIDSRKEYDIHNDFGTGSAQIIPCLAAGIALNEINYNVIIEQPELHLHPDQQCEAADSFLKAALSKNLGIGSAKYILETHSEHMLLRFLKRINLTRLDKVHDRTIPRVTTDNIGVYFVKQNREGCSEVTELELTETGDIKGGWPIGFFDQSFNERFYEDELTDQENKNSK